MVILGIFNLVFSSVYCHWNILRAHSGHRKKGGTYSQEDCMDGEPRVSSHHLHSLLPSRTSKDRWLSVLLWRNQRPRACGPKRYGWLSGNKGGASRHHGRSEKAIHKGTNHTCAQNYTYSRKKDLSRSNKLPHPATPIQGEPPPSTPTPSFHSYLLTPAPDTTAISDGEKSNEPRMTG